MDDASQQTASWEPSVDMEDLQTNSRAQPIAPRAPPPPLLTSHSPISPMLGIAARLGHCVLPSSWDAIPSLDSVMLFMQPS